MEQHFTTLTWSWNLWRDLTLLWQFDFFRLALLAGLVVAVLCATVGWFVVVRGEAYAAHTLAAAAFPGAAGAALIGLTPFVGYGASAVAAALLLGWFSGGRTSRVFGSSATTGAVQAFLLGLGYWFVTRAPAPLPSLTAYLFGTFLGVTRSDLVILTAVAAGALCVLAIIGRPLLFATVDPAVAEVAGVRVRLLGAAFLVLLALGVAQAAQFTGVLLVFALLVTPAATAQRLTHRPASGVVLGVVLAAVTTWLGLLVAFFTDLPVGFWVTVLGFAGYLAVRLVQVLGHRRGSRHATARARAVVPA